MNFIVAGLEKMKIYFFVGRATLILSSILYLDDETDLHFFDYHSMFEKSVAHIRVTN